MNDGQITRKDIITDDALNWGPDYSRLINEVIGKTRNFDLFETNIKLRASNNSKDNLEKQMKKIIKH